MGFRSFIGKDVPRHAGSSVATLVVAVAVVIAPLYLSAGCGGGSSPSSPTPTPTGTPTPTPTPAAGGLILYSSSNVTGSVNQQIYTINGEGGTVTRILSNGNDEAPYAWSPDGTKILFSSNRDNGGGGTNSRDLYRMDFNGANVTRLTNDTTKNSVNGSWSSDGTKIAFSHALRIAVMNQDGSGVTDLTGTDIVDARFPVWSPDGARIAFVAAAPNGSNFAKTIFVMQSDGTNRVALTQGDEYIQQVAWSPDGQTLVYDGSRDTGGVTSLRTQIYRMNADGTNRIRLTNNAGSDIAPAWSPDGTRLIFSSDRDHGGGSGGTNPYDLYTMNPDGSNITRLTTDGPNAFVPPGGWKR